MRLGNSNLFHILAGAFLLLIVALAQAQAADLTVSDAWIRALPASLPSGGYFTLHNDGSKPVTLIGAESPVCGTLMLHKSSDAHGMASMRDVTEIDVPARGAVTFAPGGYHMMCMDAKPALTPGSVVPVVLTFKNGVKLTAPFSVRNAAGK